MNVLPSEVWLVSWQDIYGNCSVFFSIESCGNCFMLFSITSSGNSFMVFRIEGCGNCSVFFSIESCGSCYAFSALAMVEARFRIVSNNTMQPSFSPQDIVDCSEYSQGYTHFHRFLSLCSMDRLIAYTIPLGGRLDKLMVSLAAS